MRPSAQCYQTLVSLSVTLSIIVYNAVTLHLTSQQANGIPAGYVANIYTESCCGNEYTPVCVCVWTATLLTLCIHNTEKHRRAIPTLQALSRTLPRHSGCSRKTSNCASLQRRRLSMLWQEDMVCRTPRETWPQHDCSAHARKYAAKSTAGHIKLSLLMQATFAAAVPRCSLAAKLVITGDVSRGSHKRESCIWRRAPTATSASRSVVQY